MLEDVITHKNVSFLTPYLLPPQKELLGTCYRNLLLEEFKQIF